MFSLKKGLLFASTIAATTPVVAQPPNIILFLVDDMGWQETSVPFWNDTTALNHRYRTPNMERLARMGVKFTNAYACAISSPSRCSLLSGMNAARHRVTNWTLHYNQSTDEGESNIVPPEWNVNGIQPASDTLSAHDAYRATPITALPQILKDNGYYTIHCGKAHFGAFGTAGEEPLNFGFDVNIAGGANGAPGSYLAQDNYGTGAFHVKGLEHHYARGTFLTEALTIEALQALDVPISRRQPFFLYMAHYAIHVPYNPDSRFTRNYRGVFDQQVRDILDENEVNHAALIEGMDKSLGDILDYLAARPDVAANTIVLFMSDNGGQAIGPRQGIKGFDQNYPARGGKGSAFEGGVHEPMLVCWPGVAEGGTVNDNRVMIEDFFPTILDMAGIRDYTTVQTVDGKSFADQLRNPGQHCPRTIIWHYPNLWTKGIEQRDGYGPYSAIRKGPFHLIYFWATRDTQLYNVIDDVSQFDDLSYAHPRLTRELSQELTDSLKAYGAQRPTRKSDGKPVPWPDGSPE
ncbi:MAG: sulfatase-like hydrolase/transferase [Bacteroidaceae bacterium]|nr:sulfatase-like hydrolase/transferase [Bacteroidaceae bacterium]